VFELGDNGVDTGASVRNQYVTVDGHDVWAYVMPRELKLRLGLDLARSLRELESASVVHRDIKPANMLLHVGDTELKEGLLLKLMDFGEAAAADVCSSRECIRVGMCPVVPKCAIGERNVAARCVAWNRE
jgi:serine/threonine protein kinase